MVDERLSGCASRIEQFLIVKVLWGYINSCFEAI